MAVLDRLVAFRAPTDLIEEISALARQQETSVSELLRSLICTAVASETDVAEDNLPIHTRAAAGDASALSHLAVAYEQRGIEGYEPLALSLSQAVVFGRLAACSAGLGKEWIAFISLLQRYADQLRREDLHPLADNAQAEVIALLEHMSDFGDEEAGGWVVAAGDSLSPQVLAHARNLHSLRMGEAA